jgi:hypothetical protein
MHILEQLLNYNILHIEITIESIIFLQKFHKIKNMEISIKVEALNLMSMCHPAPWSHQRRNGYGLLIVSVV